MSPRLTFYWLEKHLQDELFTDLLEMFLRWTFDSPMGNVSKMNFLLAYGTCLQDELIADP